MQTRSAATASVRFRALQQFFTWCLDEEELDVSPMAKMRPPVVPERPVPVLSEDKARALLRACASSGFVPRRDKAIVRLFLDTGMRRSELAKLRVDEVDLDDDVAIVTGKGRRPRTCPFGWRTAQALDRYLRARSRHPQAQLPALWLGANGREAMTDNGIAQVVGKRGREAGIEGLHPHMLRHTFAQPGWPRAAVRATSCAWPDGRAARCSTATPPAPPTRGPARPTDTTAWAIDCEHRVRRRLG